jgi:hypothetical protein
MKSIAQRHSARRPIGDLPEALLSSGAPETCSSLEAQLVVDLTGFLLTDHPALSAQQYIQALLSEPDMPLTNLSDPLFQSGLTGPTGSVTFVRWVKPVHRVSSANGNLPPERNSSTTFSSE